MRRNWQKHEFRMKKKLFIIIFAAAFAFIAILAWRLIPESNATLIRHLDILKAEDIHAQKVGDISNNGYEENLIRRHLLQRGYLVEVVFEMPKTHAETEQANSLWDTLIAFRDNNCSPVANFSFWPADGSTNTLYVIVRDLPDRIPNWKIMLLKQDDSAVEIKHLQGPSGAPESFPNP
jgi:hypothetical protein